MTAQVSAAEFTVAGGTVTFTDTYNGVTEVLGTVQVQSTNGTPGMAILETEVGGVGTHQFVATYGGTAAFATSASTPQAVTFAGSLLVRDGAGKHRRFAQCDAYRNRLRIWPGDSHGKCHLYGYNLECDARHRRAQRLDTAEWFYALSALYPIANMNNGNTGGTIGPAIGDFNGDGRPDYAVPTNAGPIVILLGAGNGTFTNGTTINTTAPFRANFSSRGGFQRRW